MNINDIAKMAGVSKATVSRVLNNIKVRPEYKEKVDKVLQETGYKPNRLARELVSRKTKLIGLIVPSMKANVYAYIVEGLNKVLTEHGYNLILASAIIDEKKGVSNEVELLKFMEDRLVEGVILCPGIVNTDLIDFMKNYRVPVVTIGEKIPNLEISSVVFDDYNAAKAIVLYLVGIGHQKIGYIGVDERFYSSGFLRKKGFSDAILGSGLEIDSDFIVETGFTHNDGYASARKLVSNTEKRPTAIFAALDRLAYGAMSFLIKSGINIPEDMSIVGIDDDDLSSYYNPPLTTIHFDYVNTGEKAGQILIEIIETEERKCIEHVMAYEIRERSSSI